MTLTGPTQIPNEQDVLARVISGARDALEWTTEMEELSEELHEDASDVEVSTNRLSGSFVEIALIAYFDTPNPPAKATHVMGDYKWDDSSIRKDGDQWRLYLKRRFTYS